MIKPKDPRELAETLLNRSECQVQVAAVIEDHHGILGWGWNTSGPDGLGLHAEHHAILRSNRSRLRGSTIYVASQRRRNKKIVPSKPCEDCARLIKAYKIKLVNYRDPDGWKNG